jgi:hypothetical protein
MPSKTIGTYQIFEENKEKEFIKNNFILDSLINSTPDISEIKRSLRVKPTFKIMFLSLTSMINVLKLNRKTIKIKEKINNNTIDIIIKIIPKG